MPELVAPSFDAFACAFLTCVALREVMIATLPDQIAGPGGWLVNTDRKD